LRLPVRAGRGGSARRVRVRCRAAGRAPGRCEAGCPGARLVRAWSAGSCGRRRRPRASAFGRVAEGAEICLGSDQPDASLRATSSSGTGLRTGAPRPLRPPRVCGSPSPLARDTSGDAAARRTALFITNQHSARDRWRLSASTVPGASVSDMLIARYPALVSTRTRTPLMYGNTAKQQRSAGVVSRM